LCLEVETRNRLHVAGTRLQTANGPEVHRSRRRCGKGKLDAVEQMHRLKNFSLNESYHRLGQLWLGHMEVLDRTLLILFGDVGYRSSMRE
jgi:hypothetical protein